MQRRHEERVMSKLDDIKQEVEKPSQQVVRQLRKSDAD